MTDNVVTPLFGEKPDPRIWVCLCGCRDFELYEDGTTKCPLCGSIGDGHWTAHLVDSDKPAVDYTREVRDYGTIELAKRAILRDANDKDTLVLMIAMRDGRIRLWTQSDELETNAQKAWLRDRFAGAAALALNETWAPAEDGEKP